MPILFYAPGTPQWSVAALVSPVQAHRRYFLLLRPKPWLIGDVKEKKLLQRQDEWSPDLLHDVSRRLHSWKGSQKWQGSARWLQVAWGVDSKWIKGCHMLVFRRNE